MIANTVDHGMPIVILMVSADATASQLHHLWSIIVFAIIWSSDFSEKRKENYINIS